MLTFNLTFQNTYGGITPTQAQKEALTLAANKFGQNFANEATIDLQVDSLGGFYYRTLAGALGDRIPPEQSTPGFGTTEVVLNKAIYGNDLNGDEPDGLIAVNWNQPWSLDPDREPGDREYDLYGTFYHELSHVLGFASALRPYGTDPSGKGDEEPGYWNRYDQFLTDADGNRVVSKEGLVNRDVFDRSVRGGSSKDGKGLFFVGENAVAANRGERVGLFSPEWFQSGSSVSHLDEENPELADSLMSPYVNQGQSLRHLSKIERGMFLDLGYSLASPFEVSAGNQSVGIENALGIDTLSLQLETNRLQGISDVLIFAVDEAGHRQAAGQFSVIDAAAFASAYRPTFTIDRSQIAGAQCLQVELQGAAGAQQFAPIALKDGTVNLSLGNTAFNLSQAMVAPTAQLLTDEAAAIDLRSVGYATSLSFTVHRDASLDSVVGFYETDTADGAIAVDSLSGARLLPGDTGYREAARSRRVDTMLTGESDGTSEFSGRFYGGGFLSAFIAVNAVLDGEGVGFGSASFDDATVYFSHGQANRDRHNHIKLLGDNTFGFEDSAGLGDQDYNDIVVEFSIG